MEIQVQLTYLAIVAVLMLRFTILSVTLPFLGHRSVPIAWRIALGCVIGLATAPVVAHNLSLADLHIGWPELVAEFGRSVLVGMLLGLAIGLPFTAVKFAGQVLGVQVGFAIVNTVDPQSGARISVIGQIYYLLGSLLFFAVNAHHAVVIGLVQSCTVVPLFAPVDGSAASWIMLKEFGSVFHIGLRIAAPCIIVLLLVSATMGVIVKTVPQINVLIVGFPIRIAAGLMTFGLSLVFFKDVFLSAGANMEERLVRLLTALM
ncbi:MAG: flagellar biosynthetic protein FliR [bacterium]